MSVNPMLVAGQVGFVPQFTPDRLLVALIEGSAKSVRGWVGTSLAFENLPRGLAGPNPHINPAKLPSASQNIFSISAERLPSEKAFLVFYCTYRFTGAARPRRQRFQSLWQLSCNA